MFIYLYIPFTKRSFKGFLPSYKGSATWRALSGFPSRVPLVPPDSQVPKVHLRFHFCFQNDFVSFHFIIYYIQYNI